MLASSKVRVIDPHQHDERAALPLASGAPVVTDERKPSGDDSGEHARKSPTGGDLSADQEAGVHEAVGLFASVEALQGAIDELLSSGFDRADLSLLGSEHVLQTNLAHHLTRRELEDDPAAARGVYVSPDAIGTAEGSLISVLAYVGGIAAAGVIAIGGGPLTMIILGAGLAGGAGGIIGTGLAKLLGHRRAEDIRSHLEAGGLLLWVRTWHIDDQHRALGILSRHSGRDVHVHVFQETSRPQVRTGPS